MPYRLGLDLGTNSLGWCALELNDAGKPVSILAMGIRIFNDGRDDGQPLAVARRAARAMRRRRDRFIRRRTALLKHLTADGLFPADAVGRQKLRALDPFALRARALDERLDLHEIGRALFHLNQRRGFESNRKADRTNEKGKIAPGIERLHRAMADTGARTYGEFLHLRRAGASDPNMIPSVRTRLANDGKGYDFYPSRALLKKEFEAIIEAQARHHPAVLTKTVRDRLFEIIFHQRPLKKPEVGLCSLLGTEERLPKAHPLFQKRRLLEELNALMVTRPGEYATKLTLDQRNLLLRKLGNQRKATFTSLRKVLKLPRDARFNKESENRTELAGDEVAAEFGNPNLFGTRWAHMSWQEQWDVVKRLVDVESDDDSAAFQAWLETEKGLSADQAKAVLDVRLPSGYGRFGETATLRLIKALEQKVLVYSDAVALAGLGHHSDRRTGEIIEKLPYYNEVLQAYVMPGSGKPEDHRDQSIGRLTNPTVHIGLNQLRHVVNELIRRFGKPAEIAIELARELKLTEEEKRNRNRQNATNRKDAARRSEKLRELGQTDNGANRMRLKLWEELNPKNALDRRCVFSGRQISIDMLFSDAVEIEHILPFSETLDDSYGNKVLSLREANRVKGKREPYEAHHDLRAHFGEDAAWESIAARVAHLSKEKRRRFEPGALRRFKENDGFLARQLVDTQYLGRLAHQYLSRLYPDKGEGSSKVWVSPGRMTEMVRRKLGLNELLPDHNFAGGADQPKNRKDHRHHAIDAFVIGIVDRSLLQRIARASGEGGGEERERVIVPEPWEEFRNELRAKVNCVVVAHRADHGTYVKPDRKLGRDSTAAKLHNDTAYGLTGEKDAKGNDLVVSRAPLTALKKRSDIADPSNPAKGVRDPVLRQALLDFVGGREGEEFEARIREFPHLGPLPFRGIRRVRLMEPLNVIPIRDRNGVPYKGYKGDSNARYDVWELKDGKWVAEVVPTFDAHQPGWTSRIRADNPTARKVLSLCQNDIVAYEPEGGGRRLMRVVKFGQNGQITLAEHNEAGDLKKRNAQRNDQDPFKYIAPTAGGLKKARVRQVRVDVLGYVQDPGFPARKAIRRTKSKPA